MDITPDLVLYHKGCMDGLAAAWAVWKRFGNANTDYLQVAYGEAPPDVQGKHVVIVDFSFPHADTVAMSYKAASLLVLDHHKTAEEALARLPFAGLTWTEFHKECAFECYANNMPLVGMLFDPSRSGAGIAWGFFHFGKTRPALLDHVQDRDLWKFFLPGTREVHAAITAYPYAIEEFDRLVTRCEADHAGLVCEGAAILRSWDKSVRDATKAARRRMVIGGFEVPVANVPYAMASDAGHLLGENEPFAATYYDSAEGRVFSLRSHSDGMDVSIVAKKYGGGGHKHAAGFRAALGWEGEG